jgi:hypothetical protein
LLATIILGFQTVRSTIVELDLVYSAPRQTKRRCRARPLVQSFANGILMTDNSVAW